VTLEKFSFVLSMSSTQVVLLLSMVIDLALKANLVKYNKPIILITDRIKTAMLITKLTDLESFFIFLFIHIKIKIKCPIHI